MATYQLKQDQRAFSFDRTIPPVLRIVSGDTVTFETGDVAYERLSKGEAVEAIGLENFNAVTGPVYVEDAEPGDALKVGIWSQLDPAPEKTVEELELAGTVADEAELVRFLKPMNPCGK